MAAVKGDVGQVKFDDGGSSVNPVLGTRSWSMSMTKDCLLYTSDAADE